MKTNKLKNYVLVFLLGLSLFSFAYLNFMAAPSSANKLTNREDTIKVEEQKEILWDITLIKVVINKVREVIDFKVG